jgi:hypothetical protein
MSGTGSLTYAAGATPFADSVRATQPRAEEEVRILMNEYGDHLKRHYELKWRNSAYEKQWSEGPMACYAPDFQVFEFAPSLDRAMWTYATCCMSFANDDRALELHMFSPQQNDLLVELLAAIAHYHRSEAHLGLGDTVNFGRPWLPHSKCTYGIVSLPYLDGPKLEWLCLPSELTIRCLWLIPITRKERDFKMTCGLDALEGRFEQASFNYLDPRRLSVV